MDMVSWISCKKGIASKYFAPQHRSYGIVALHYKYQNVKKGRYYSYKYYILNLSDPCPSIENKSRILHFTVLSCPNTNLYPRGHEFYIVGYHYYTLSLSDLCLGVDTL